MPKASALRDEAAELRDQWQKLRRREMAPAEFRELYARIDTFFVTLNTDAGAMYDNLSEILLAQDFQDLTGQVIQKVTTLVKEVEEHLLSLVVMASHVDQMTGTVHELEEREKISAEQGVGPQIKAEEREDDRCLLGSCISRIDNTDSTPDNRRPHCRDAVVALGVSIQPITYRNSEIFRRD